MSAFENFRIARHGHVAVVTIDRPPVNAMDRTVRTEGTEIFSMLGEDADCRAIVLTGAGRTFCAGADLNDRPDPTVAGAYTTHNRSVREFFQTVVECAKPVIVAINGPAIGGGFVLATCGDILVASDDAWVSMPEVDIGLAGGVRHMLRHFGQSDARLLMFTGRRVGTQELLRMGVLSETAPAEKMLEVAVAIGQEIARKSPAAVVAVKGSFLLGEEVGLHSGYRYEQGQSAILAKGQEHGEARAAFRERRPPKF